MSTASALPVRPGRSTVRIFRDAPWLTVLFLGIIAALSLPSVAEGPASASDPIVGRWRWCNNTEVYFHDDGTAGLAPEKHGGTWKCVNPNQDPRKYICDWGKGMWVDTLYLKKHSNKLSGHNQFKDPVWGYRLPE